MTRPPETDSSEPDAETTGSPQTGQVRPHYTVRLGQDDWPEERVGGKANGLHRLDRLGFDTPDAFCITTDAFDDIVESCIPNASSLEELRAEILQVDMPEDLVAEIQQRLTEIGADRWAVRSSSIDEDDLAHSFAGQQRTVLGSEALPEVLASVREVWASLYNEEALLYRTRLKVGLEPSSMGVVIQEMVEPRVAGVLFTQNPITADDTQVVVNAAPGDQPQVVAGGAADSYYLEKSNGYVERHELGRAESDEFAEGALRRGELEALTEVARRVDRFFDHPQDIEWVWTQPDDEASESELRILQTRPITGLERGERETSVWTNVNVGEALPGVATPLTWSIIHNFSQRGFEQAFGSLGLSVPEDYELVGSFRGRVYLNLTQFMSIASGIPVLSPDTLFVMAGGGGVELVKGIYEERAATEFLQRLPITLPTILTSQLSMPLLAPIWGAYFAAKRDDFFQRDLERLNHAKFRSLLDKVDRIFNRNGQIMLAGSSNFLMSYVVMRKFLEWLGGPEGLQNERELVSALEVDSAEPGLDLLELGRVARRSRRLRRVICETDPSETLWRLQELDEHEDVQQFLELLEDFRDEHGHRAPREAELATPRWREDTSFLFEVVRSYIRAPHLPSEREMEKRSREARERVDEIVDSTFPPGLATIFGFLLDFTRKNARIREFMRARVVDTLDMYREFFLDCGRRLVAIDAIRRREDVFFLRYDEIRAWMEDPAHAGSFKLRVLLRRALQDAFSAQPDPPNTFVLDGEEIIGEQEYMRRQKMAGDYKVDTSPTREIRGLPGSAGKATGRARVIRDPNEGATLEPGEILVAPYTDVGWTPMFLTASAVVMSLGGPLSHSCIVAREYGIPTVVNAHGACDVIEDGDLITVDGDQGVVYIREKGG
ncbi:MAG: PEP/pyruvate-binding domain-containing protein [Myxococcota bacterium]